MRRSAAVACLVLLIGSPQALAGLDAQAVNDAQLQSGSTAPPNTAPSKASPSKTSPPKTSPPKQELLVKAQVLLSRAHFSPGEIDGKPGSNFAKALSAFASERGLQASDRLTDDIWRELTGISADPVLSEYTITEADVRGPFVAKIPARLEAMKHLPALSYANARELLAEKFHVSEALLAALNPGKNFDSGERIVVPNMAQVRLGKVARIEVNKTDQTLKAFGADGKLVAFYPVTAGSGDKPAPSGQLKVTLVKKNPVYRYNPEYKFKGVHAKRPFTIQAGPNNPVGAVWIGLSGEGYGLHGAPEPAKIGKTESHGCIRLTNWDALELADAVGKGVPVDFAGDEQEGRIARAQAQGSKARKAR